MHYPSEMIREDSQMAKRGKNKRSRRRNTAINLLNIGEAYAQTAIVTDVAFGLSPYNFLMSKESIAGSPSSPYRITLKELLYKFNTPHAMTGGKTMTEAELVWKNIADGWVGGLWKTEAVGVGFRVAKKVLAKPRRQINAGLKAAQLNTMIKV